MRRAIRVHERDFGAIVVLLLAAIATVAYILVHQPSFTFGHSLGRRSEKSQAAASTCSGEAEV